MNIQAKIEMISDPVAMTIMVGGRVFAGIKGGSVDQVYAACNAHVSEECRAFANKIAAQYVKISRAVAA